VCGIGDVQQIVEREFAMDLTEDRQTADAGIEYSDRGVVGQTHSE
jgi:hypothetical protein